MPCPSGSDNIMNIHVAWRPTQLVDYFLRTGNQYGWVTRSTADNFMRDWGSGGLLTGPQNFEYSRARP